MIRNRKIRKINIECDSENIKNEINKKDFYIQCYQKKYKNFGFLYEFLLLIGECRQENLKKKEIIRKIKIKEYIQCYEFKKRKEK